MSSDKFMHVVEMARALSPIEKIRLVEDVMTTLEKDLSEQVKMPRKSLYGLWADVDISAEDIDTARNEMWGNFPREDI